MSRVICTERLGAKTLAILKKSVEQVVKENKKVFDELAKK